jgi:hypothetical protein
MSGVSDINSTTHDGNDSTRNQPIVSTTDIIPTMA